MKGSYRLDGWKNVLTKLGIKEKDKRTATHFSGVQNFAEIDLSDMYAQEGFLSRIIDLPVDYATRQDFIIKSSDLEQEDIDGIHEELKRLKFNSMLKRAMKWDRLFGGAGLVLNVDDGEDIENEIDERRIRRINGLRVYDRFRFQSNVSSDIVNLMYGMFDDPILLTPISGTPFCIHPSRAAWTFGIDVPERRREELNGWGETVVGRTFTQLRQLSSAYSSTEFILEDFIQTVVTINNLTSMIAQQGNDTIQKRLDILDLSRHIANTWLLDAEEKYEKHSSTVTGIDKLIQQFGLALCAVEGIPYTLLFGDSVSGLSATGDNERSQWFDKVGALQTEKAKPIIEYVVKKIMLSSDGPTNGIVPDSWKIVFPPLEQMSEKEIAETNKLNAETDKTYIEMGVVSQSEVAESRFSGDDSVYSIDFSIQRAGAPVNDPVQDA